MDFGINLATSADSWKVVKRAEELGYARAWFYDTQLLNADMFVAMGAAAVQTSRIRLATGVLIPSNRIAPVAASALASLNALAPGRVDFGISTGFTARRTMGLGPVTLDSMREYIRIVQGLIAGETLEWDFEGDGQFTKTPIRSGRQVSLDQKHRFTKPGTYFPVVRVTAQREGDPNTPFGLIQNLASIRVVVR